MRFDINTMLGDMVAAVGNAVENYADKIGPYVQMILEKEKESLEELAQARLAGEISEQEFYDEMEREKMVVQAELLTLQIMTKAMAQKAVNAAMAIFINAVKLAV